MLVLWEGVVGSTSRGPCSRDPITTGRTTPLSSGVHDVGFRSFSSSVDSIPRQVETQGQAPRR